MAKQIKVVEFESIVEQLHKEYGESYRSVFNKDKASFNLPEHLEPLTKGEQSLFDKPVGGRTKEKWKPSEINQFKDENAQLSLKSSSTIQSAAFWPSRKYLLVSFKSGHTYSYNGVTVDVVRHWEQAGSAGSFFYYNIRTSYPYQKMG